MVHGRNVKRVEGNNGRKGERVKDLPKGIRMIGSSMAFALKRDANDKITRARARWVLRGDMLDRGTHVHATAAHTPAATSFKTHVAMAATKRANLRSADVKGAFLFADSPPGTQCAFRAPRDQPDLHRDEQGCPVVYINEKCQYGHPGASLAWQNHFHSWLSQAGWKRVQYEPTEDPTVQRHSKEDTPHKKHGCTCNCHETSETTDMCVYEIDTMRLPVHVDDLSCHGDTESQYTQFEKELKDEEFYKTQLWKVIKRISAIELHIRSSEDDLGDTAEGILAKAEATL